MFIFLVNYSIKFKFRPTTVITSHVDDSHNNEGQKKKTKQTENLLEPSLIDE